MNHTITNAGRWLLAAGALFLASGCALQLQVREDWDVDFDGAIPIEETAATWRDIRSGRTPGEERLEAYNEAVQNSIVQITNNWVEDKDSFSTLETSAGEVELRVVSHNVRHVDLVEEVVPADFVQVRRGFDTETVVDGLGASLMMKQRWSESDPMIPKDGLWYPATAVLDLDEPHRPVLELIDPTKDGEFVFGGREFPLEANYTATFARDFLVRKRLFPELPALLRFEKFADRMGLYRVSTIDPDKQVCVLVHGINSDPSTWHETLNQLYAEEEIRERYEFWTFGYPTGAPIPYLAMKFREALREMKAYRSEQGAGESRMVILSHSMGGLLAKAATQSGGDEDWNKFFTVPLEELDVSLEDRRVLRRMVYYEPVSGIERVVFCATPHGGSKLAAIPVTRLLGDLAQVPAQLAELSREIVQQSRHALTPLGLEVVKKAPTSIDQLRPTSGASVRYLDKPLNPDVQFHSIIGNRGRIIDVPLKKAGDGVVPYTSAHIEGVQSEVVVEGSGHGVHKTPEGIEEIERILKLP